MKKNLFFTLTLLTSQSSHTIDFRTPLYVGKEALKTICDGAAAYHVIALGYRLTPENGHDDNVMKDVFRGPEISSILIMAGVRTGIYIIENNLATYYTQFQEWRKNRSASNSSSALTNP